MRERQLQKYVAAIVLTCVSITSVYSTKGAQFSEGDTTRGNEAITGSVETGEILAGKEITISLPNTLEKEIAALDNISEGGVQGENSSNASGAVAYASYQIVDDAPVFDEIEKSETVQEEPDEDAVMSVDPTSYMEQNNTVIFQNLAASTVINLCTGEVTERQPIGTYGDTLSKDEIDSIIEAYGDTVSGTRKEIIKQALYAVGHIPYEYGGKHDENGWNYSWGCANESGKMEGLDCSGFVEWVIRQAFSNNAYTEAEMEAVSSLSSTISITTNNANVKQIKRKNLKPGDMGTKFKGGSDATKETYNHVGIFLGYDENGEEMWVHCTTGDQNTVVMNHYSGFKMFWRLELENMETDAHYSEDSPDWTK